MEYKIVSVEYFMHHLDDVEIEMILDNMEFADRNEWEQARLQMYITAQVNSTKKMNPKDIITFPWEKAKPVDNDEYEKAKQFALQFQKQLKTTKFKEESISFGVNGDKITMK